MYVLLCFLNRKYYNLYSLFRENRAELSATTIPVDCIRYNMISQFLKAVRTPVQSLTTYDPIVRTCMCNFGFQNFCHFSTNSCHFSNFYATSCVPERQSEALLCGFHVPDLDQQVDSTLILLCCLSVFHRMFLTFPFISSSIKRYDAI